MPVTIKSTGGGSVTLQAPNTASDFTATLPSSSGTLLAPTGGIVPAANGGTGLTSPGASGNVLTSNGTAWTSAAAPATGQIQSQLFTASGSWTAPTGVTKVKAIVIGGGGGGNVDGCSPTSGYRGGVAVGYYTVVPGTAYTITVGTAGAGGTTTLTAGNTSSFASFASATGAGTGADGSATGANLRSGSALASSGAGSPFTGPISSASTAAQAYSATTNNGAGQGGAGATSTQGKGGIGGIVYLEWVG